MKTYEVRQPFSTAGINALVARVKASHFIRYTDGSIVFFREAQDGSHYQYAVYSLPELWCTEMDV